ncbi:MAG: hypothetical protein KBD37_00370 [Burkholderiales bacterium]|nr:hypothetical protein [Burkholderiales bacterium]
MQHRLILRLNELRYKMKLAKTAGEKQVYKESIAHCIEDIKHGKANARKDIIRLTLGLAVFLTLILMLLYLGSKLSHQENETQSIGHAVEEALV